MKRRRRPVDKRGAGATTAEELIRRAYDEDEAGRPRRAFALFLRAAEMGNASAQNSVGYFYDHAIGVAKDHDKAVFWYRKAARGGDVLGYHNMAMVHRDTGNIRRARFWLAKVLAEREDDSHAFLEHAKLCLSGRRTNVAQARKYLKLALRSRSMIPNSKEEAQTLLDELDGAARRKAP